MRILGTAFNIGATFGADADGRVCYLDRSKERLLDPNSASHHFGVEADAFFEIAAGNADVVKRVELRRAVYAGGLVALSGIYSSIRNEFII